MKNWIAAALILISAVVVSAATIDQTPLIPGALLGTDKVPVGRVGVATGYTASINQIGKAVQAQFSTAGILKAGVLVKSVYDPTSRNADAFARGNHTGTQSADTITNGITNKVYTATEQARLAAKLDAAAQAVDSAKIAGITPSPDAKILLGHTFTDMLSDIGAATAAQGVKADTAMQPTSSQSSTTGIGGAVAAALAGKSDKSSLVGVDVGAYGVKGDGKSDYHISISAGSSTLTTTSGYFTPNDVGKTIWIQGAGAAGVTLQSTIQSYSDSNHVTIAATASTTVAVNTRTAVWGTDDTVAIQAAIDAQQSICGYGPRQGLCPELKFSAANYIVSSTIYYKSAAWRGMGSVSTQLLWVGVTDGLMVDVPTGYPNGASWGGIYGIGFKKGVNYPATHLKFEGLVDSQFYLEDDAFYGASGNAIDIAGGFVNLHWTHLRWDTISGYWIRFVLYGGSGISASIDQFTGDASGSWASTNGDTPPTAPKGVFLIDNSPYNSTEYGGTFKFSNARIETNGIQWDATAAIIAAINTSVSDNNGVPAYVYLENITGQNSGNTVTGAAPSILYGHMPGVDLSTVKLYMKNVHLDNWASRFFNTVPSGSAVYDYGFLPNWQGHADEVVFDGRTGTVGGRIIFGAGPLWDYVTFSATDDVFQSRDATHMSGSTNFKLFSQDVAGKMKWYSGSSSAPDTNLYRASAGVLQTDQLLNAVGGLESNGVAVTAQGNSFNGASQLVKLGSDGKMPAVDGSNMINLPSGGMQIGGDIGNTLASPRVISINGQTISAVPVMAWGGKVEGASTAASQISSQLTTTSAVTFLRMQAFAVTPAVTCSTSPVLAILDTSNSNAVVASLTISNATTNFDSGVITVNIPAGHVLQPKFTTAASGCATSPGGMDFQLQYRMQ